MSGSDVAPFDLRSTGEASSALEAVSRPLLRPVQHISGMETSFFTAIDWGAQRQDVLFSLNTGGLQVAEKSSTDWNDSMCRSMFLAGQPASQNVGSDVVATRARSGRRHYDIGVLVIDADRFKTINDTLGHLVGDEVLGGASLRQAAHREDLIARLGGDEFAMAVCHASRDDLITKAQSIRHHFGVIAAKLGVDTTLSIGIAHSHDTPRQKLLGDADQALYRSKAAGGDCATTFTSDNT